MMGIRDLIQRLSSSSSARYVTWQIDPYEGLDFIFHKGALSNPDKFATENPFFGIQYAYLKGLLEQGFADRNANGFTVASEVVPDLGEDFVSLFDLPPEYPGQYHARFEGSTGQASFSVDVDLLLADGSRISRYTLKGPFIELAKDEIYRLAPSEWSALSAVKRHSELSNTVRGEYENNWVVFQLQLAKRAGMKIDLAHFDKLELSQPGSVGVAVEELANGDLSLSPTYGAGIDLEDIKRRLGQIRPGQSHCVLRVKDKLVLLDKSRLEATEEILTNRRIPKDQVKTFLNAPTAYLNAALIDLENGFSLRVHGAERFSLRYFGDVEESGIDWFAVGENLVEPPERLAGTIDTEESLNEIQTRLEDANNHGATTFEYDARSFDISDKERVATALDSARERLGRGDSSAEEQYVDQTSTVTSEKAVIAIDSNDEEEQFSRSTKLTGFDTSSENFSHENLKRHPFPHQVEGVAWLLAHLESTRRSSGGGGALLADDMGLGKTYMTLVAIEEWYRRCKTRECTEKPVLIVAPLSLLENWKDEVEHTFHNSPFSDIVVLQAGLDLPRYKISGAGRETKQEFHDSDLITEKDEIRYSLKVGRGYGSGRLDMPGRLVLTTYQTLRDYQFSLSLIDWSLAAFDEAQNLKNPNTLATRAAKALNADFKLLATGTPVENSLKDFWCLMDTAIPGLLGAWQNFRTTYISPITSASQETVREVKIEIGTALREKVGDFMLRRTKADELKGLPQKKVYTGDSDDISNSYLPMLGGVMSGGQLSHYNKIIASVQDSTVEDRRTLILPALLKLKIASIHQDIEAKSPIPPNTKELQRQAQCSVKMTTLLSLLGEIQNRNEKVIIFATTKAVQAYICALVTSTFRIPVDTINGDTKTVATKRDTETRKGIIDRFQREEGFGVIVMSPVAAGVGLTVVAANNVIHMERHWNPAKEAQATDRVYRIGQTKDVNVYMPMALHPTTKSFDLKLNGLLVNKVDLSDAVVAPSTVESSDLETVF